MFLLTAEFVLNSHIKARIYFVFPKNVLKQTWNSFNTKFWSQWKDRKSSYQVREILALFCNLIALILSWNSVKTLRNTKILEEIKFEGLWGELGSIKDFQRQSLTICLRLGRNNALREKFNFCFSRVFYLIDLILS